MELATDLPGCTLRPWRDSDVPALVHHGDNRHVWRNLSDMFPSPYTDADARFWVTFANEPGPGRHFAIALDGEAIGGIGLIAGDPLSPFTAQFGYWLGEAHWGRGIATAAARALVTHAFTDLPFIRLEASVFAWNPSSMRVLEKLGFAREGVRRSSVVKDGAIIDSVLYARVRDL